MTEVITELSFNKSCYSSSAPQHGERDCFPLQLDMDVTEEEWPRSFFFCGSGTV